MRNPRRGFMGMMKKKVYGVPYWVIGLVAAYYLFYRKSSYSGPQQSYITKTGPMPGMITTYGAPADINVMDTDNLTLQEAYGLPTGTYVSNV